MNMIEQTKVADLTVDQLKTIIHDAVIQTLAEILHDPDEGLSLREDVRLHLESSLMEPANRLISAQELAAKLGLDW